MSWKNLTSETRGKRTEWKGKVMLCKRLQTESHEPPHEIKTSLRGRMTSDYRVSRASIKAYDIGYNSASASASRGWWTSRSRSRSRSAPISVSTSQWSPSTCFNRKINLTFLFPPLVYTREQIRGFAPCLLLLLLLLLLRWCLFWEDRIRKPWFLLCRENKNRQHRRVEWVSRSVGGGHTQHNTQTHLIPLFFLYVHTYIHTYIVSYLATSSHSHHYIYMLHNGRGQFLQCCCFISFSLPANSSIVSEPAQPGLPHTVHLGTWIRRWSSLRQREESVRSS